MLEFYDAAGIRRLGYLGEKELSDFCRVTGINGVSTLKFNCLVNDKTLRLTESENRIRFEDEEYIVKTPVTSLSDEGGISVSCVSAAEELLYRYIDETISFSNASIGYAAASVLENTGWTLKYCDPAITALRDVKLENLNRLEAMNELLTLFGAVDEYLYGPFVRFDTLAKTVSLYNEVGKDNGVKVRSGRNLKNLDLTYDSKGLITRLYVKGKDGLSISDINNGCPYIENFSYFTALGYNTADAGIRERLVREDAVTYDKISDLTELLTQGKRKLAAIAWPKLSVSMELADLYRLYGEVLYRIAVGDWVTVEYTAPQDISVAIKVRVIEMTEYPYEPHRNSITVGTPKPQISDAIKPAVTASRIISGSRQISSLLQGFINTAATLINGTKGLLTISDNTIDLWEIDDEGRRNGKGVRLSPGGLGITSDGGQTYDEAITGDGILASKVIAKEGIYVFTVNAEGVTDYTGSIAGVPGTELVGDLSNWNNRNDRIGEKPAAPAISADGTAIDHTVNTDGSCNLSFEWDYPAVSGVLLSQGKTYTKSAEPVSSFPDAGNQESTDGILAGDYGDGRSYGYQVAAGSMLELDITIDLESVTAVNRVKIHNWEGSNPYGPDSVRVSVSADGSSFSSIGYAQTIEDNWTLLDFNDISARYVRFTLSKHNDGGWGKDWLFVDELQVWYLPAIDDAHNIDGFVVYVHAGNTSSAYQFGTGSETAYVMPLDKRALVLYGCPVNQYYSFGVKSYRMVDNDIDPAGVLYSEMAVPTLSAENPYRPGENVAFAGNVTGTVDNVDASVIAGHPFASGGAVHGLPQYVQLKGDGLHVYDNDNKDRAHFGGWTVSGQGRYGMRVLASDGTTVILDDRGMLQTWQLQMADNVDASHPLKIIFYVPPGANLNNGKLFKLSFTREWFRAYETGAGAGGGFYTSTQQGGYTATSTGSGGGEYETSEPGVWTLSPSQYLLPDFMNYAGYHYHDTTMDSGGTHNHGITNGTTLLTNNGTVVWQQSGYHGHVLHNPYAGDHAHSMYSVSHTHAVDIPAHSHNVTVPDHRHDVSLGDHTHNLVFGIYEGPAPADISVKLDGYDLTSPLGGPFNQNVNDLELSSYVSSAGWHILELGSSSLGRINASLFIQLFMYM